MDASITALVVSQLITACSYEPLNIKPQTNNIKPWPRTMNSFWPPMGKRDTKVSEPK